MRVHLVTAGMFLTKPDPPNDKAVWIQNDAEEQQSKAPPGTQSRNLQCAVTVTAAFIQSLKKDRNGAQLPKPKWHQKCHGTVEEMHVMKGAKAVLLGESGEVGIL